MQQRLIKPKRSIIFAADMPPKYLGRLAKAASQVPDVSAIKLGLVAGLAGLKRKVAAIKDVDADLLVIFDLQKGGNDIPDMGNNFALALKEAHVDAAILFPFAGPTTQETWTKACFDAGLDVLTGGMMTHNRFLVSDGGYIPDDVPERIFHKAVELGGTNFVVPGNKLPWVEKLRKLLDEAIGPGKFDLYAPGFVKQGGIISECGQAAGELWHAIVGTAIYGKEKVNSLSQMVAAAQEHAQAIAA